MKVQAANTAAKKAKDAAANTATPTRIHRAINATKKGAVRAGQFLKGLPKDTITFAKAHPKSSIAAGLVALAALVTGIAVHKSHKNQPQVNEL
jgi:hypothetical protein